jgi:outer membrane immunogenic protein
MKRILFTTVSLGVLGLMSPALAADLPMKAGPIVAPMYDWSGFYVGVFGGGGMGNHNYNNGTPTNYANYLINYDSTGGIAGGEVGYNVQSGVMVAGVEANGFWSGIKGSDLSQFNAGALPINAIDASNLRWGASLVARGGIAVDRLLLFFTGGWAYGNILHTSTTPGIPGVFPTLVDQFTNHQSGLTAGGGIAYAVTNNLIGKIEYRYYAMGRYDRAGNPLTPNLQTPYTVDNTYSVVTLGLDYKFGGPVVARY